MKPQNAIFLRKEDYWFNLWEMNFNRGNKHLSNRLCHRFLVLILLQLTACSNHFMSFHETEGLSIAGQLNTAEQQVTMRFLGTTTFLIEYKNTRIMTDGYFSRQPHRVLGQIAPDQEHISDVLRNMSIATLGHDPVAQQGNKLDAVIVLHGHYDHGLDSGLVASLTGAELYADGVTIQTARKALEYASIDAPLKTKQLTVGPTFDIGELKLRLIEIPHSENAASRAIDKINEKKDWRFPTRIWNMKMDQSVALHVMMGSQSLLIVPSAGPVSDEFHALGISADVVFLGIGALGWQSDKEAAAYIHNSVITTGAQRVVPIHWDNHQKQLTLGNATLHPPLYECLNCALRSLRNIRSRRYELSSAPVFEPFDPFENLKP